MMDYRRLLYVRSALLPQRVTSKGTLETSTRPPLPPAELVSGKLQETRALPPQKKKGHHVSLAVDFLKVLDFVMKGLNGFIPK